MFSEKLYIKFSILSFTITVVGLSLLLNSCSSKDKSEQKKEVSTDKKEALYYDQDIPKYDHLKTDFPKDNSPSEIKIHITVSELPKEEDLKDCRDSLKITADQIEFEKAFAEQTRLLLPSVGRDPGLYHWCFFEGTIHPRQAARKLQPC